MNTEQDTMFEQAMQAIDQRDIPRARDLLTRLIHAEKENATYWLWMSAVVATRKEKIFCLEQVLRLDPDNPDARYGLVLFGVIPPDDKIVPVPPPHRKWESLYTTLPSQNDQNNISTWRIVSSIAVGLLVVSLFIWGIFGSSLRTPFQLFGRHLTITPVAWTPTVTLTHVPTLVAEAVKPTPRLTQAEPTALIDLLQATYTPTPLYINTPHPKSEAYQMAINAFQNGDLDGVLEYMSQAEVVEPQAVDLLYYIAETYRQKGNYTKALEAFQHIIDLNNNFAPAYLGLARTLLVLNPLEDISSDLENAITKDPGYSEAYLERAVYYLNHRKPKEAGADLNIALKLSPNSPFVYLYLAQVSLAEGDASTALDYAQKALNLDITLLPVYKTIGQAYLKTNSPKNAAYYLDIYTQLNKEDGVAWTDLGQAYYETNQDNDKALKALNTAVMLTPKAFNAYLYRGLTYLRLEKGQLAVNDFMKARLLDMTSFEASLWLGVSLQKAGRSNDALAQLNVTLPRANSDQQKAMIFYWRAQILETLDNRKEAIRDWNLLLKLPKAAIPEDWFITANNHLQSFFTPTPIRTPTRTPTPSKTPKVSPTHKSTSTLLPKITPTLQPTIMPTVQ